MRTFTIIAIVIAGALSCMVPVVSAAQTVQTYDMSGNLITVPTGTGAQATIGTQTGAGATIGENVKLVNPLKATTLEQLVSDILDVIIRIGTIVVVLMVVFVGYKFVVAQGKEAELTEAKRMLLWTIVGALILLGSKAIQIGIQSTVTALGG